MDSIQLLRRPTERHTGTDHIQRVRAILFRTPICDEMLHIVQAVQRRCGMPGQQDGVDHEGRHQERRDEPYVSDGASLPQSSNSTMFMVQKVSTSVLTLPNPARRSGQIVEDRDGIAQCPVQQRNLFTAAAGQHQERVCAYAQRCLDITQRIADHVGTRQLKIQLTRCLMEQPCLRLATGTSLVRTVRTVENRVYAPTGHLHLPLHRLGDGVHRGVADQSTVDGGLVADHNDGHSHPGQPTQCFQGAGKEDKLGKRLYIVRTVLIDDTIPIKKYRPAHVHQNPREKLRESGRQALLAGDT